MNDVTRYPELDRSARLYNRLLDEAKAVSHKSLERLRELNRRFDFPEDLIHELEELEGGTVWADGGLAFHRRPAPRAPQAGPGAGHF
jgi:hypothetical protein